VAELEGRVVVDLVMHLAQGHFGDLTWARTIWNVMAGSTSKLWWIYGAIMFQFTAHFLY
jgi:hypothetical protein